MGDLGQLLLRKGDLREALELCLEVLGKHHPRMQACKQRLDVALAKKG